MSDEDQKSQANSLHSRSRESPVTSCCSKTFAGSRLLVTIQPRMPFSMMCSIASERLVATSTKPKTTRKSCDCWKTRGCCRIDCNFRTRYNQTVLFEAHGANTARSHAPCCSRSWAVCRFAVLCMLHTGPKPRCKAVTWFVSCMNRAYCLV